MSNVAEKIEGKKISDKKSPERKISDKKSPERKISRNRPKGRFLTRNRPKGRFLMKNFRQRLVLLRIKHNGKYSIAKQEISLLFAGGDSARH
jgi:hypothetical protein